MKVRNYMELLERVLVTIFINTCALPLNWISHKYSQSRIVVIG